MQTDQVRRKTDTVAALVVLGLGLPLVVLGLLDVARAWQDDGDAVPWQLAFVLVVLIGMWRSGRVLLAGRRKQVPLPAPLPRRRRPLRRGGGGTPGGPAGLLEP